MVRFVPINSVLGKCGLSPGIDASDTMDVQVDVQIDETAARWTYSVSYSESGILYRPRKALRLRSG